MAEPVVAISDFFEVIGTQRAMRRLKPDPVPEEYIKKIIWAATRAPSGGNRQGWRWLVITDPENKKKIQGWYNEGWSKMMARQAERLERDGTMVVGLGELRVDGDHRVGRGQRVGVAGEIEQDARADVLDAGVTPLVRERDVAMAQGLVEAPQRLQDVGVVRVRVGGLRLRRDRAREQARAFARMAPLRAQHAQEVQGIELLGRHLEHRAVDPLRIGVTSGVMPGDRLLDRLGDGHLSRGRSGAAAHSRENAAMSCPRG